MKRFEKRVQSHQAKTQTIAETLLYLRDPRKRIELEKFRLDYEAYHGPTDLTKRYTSTWPSEQQEILRKADIRLYIEGFPPFAKEYLKQLMIERKKIGRLDDTPDDILELFLSGEMGNSNIGKNDNRNI